MLHFPSSLSHGYLWILLLQSLSSGPVLGRLSLAPSSLHRGTGSIMEEGASRGRGTRRAGEFGNREREPNVMKRGKVWEWMGISPIHALPFTLGHSELLSLIKTYPELTCSECARKSISEVALVYSQLLINVVNFFKWC